MFLLGEWNHLTLASAGETTVSVSAMLRRRERRMGRCCPRRPPRGNSSSGYPRRRFHRRSGGDGIRAALDERAPIRAEWRRLAFRADVAEHRGDVGRYLAEASQRSYQA